MLQNWNTHDPWQILDEITMKAGEGLCMDALDMRIHRKNYGIKERVWWAFVPINGKIHGAPFGHTQDRCIFSDAKNSWDILTKIGPATGFDPLKDWSPHWTPAEEMSWVLPL